MVTRYKQPHMMPQSDGEFVSYEDYAALETERNKALAAAERQWEGWVKEEVARKVLEARCAKLEKAQLSVKRISAPVITDEMLKSAEAVIFACRHVYSDKDLAKAVLNEALGAGR